MSDLTESALQWLFSPAAFPWLAEAADMDESELQLRRRLESHLSAEQARWVVLQVALRRKAQEKFGPLAGQMFFTDLGLQQATDLYIAGYKASRFPQGVPVVDYCCGIGGDLLALADRGAVVGWDRSAEMAQIAEANLRAWNRSEHGRVGIGEVEQHPPQAGEFWHIDPDRRSGGQRSTSPQWHSPSESTISEWLSAAPHGAVKLAPAARLPKSWHQQAELEWISRGRQCRQLVAWFGDLAPDPGQRRATLVEPADAESGPTVASFVGDAGIEAPLAEQVSEYLFDTDPSIRAAGLTGALAVCSGCEALSSGASYLTGDHDPNHPLLAAFRVEQVFPLRVADLAKELRSRGIGQLEIKTRNVSTSPDQLRKRLKLHGDRAATLLLTRIGRREIAVLAERRGNVGISHPLR